MSDEKISEKNITPMVIPEENLSKRKKFFKALINDDIESIEDHIIFGVLIPSIKDTIIDVVSGTVDMIFNEPVGRTRSRSRSSGSGKKSQTSYYMCSTGRTEISSVSRSSEDERVQIMDNGWNIRFKDHDLVMKFYENVMELMQEYNNVTVSDLFQIANKTLDNWAIGNLGWVMSDWDILPRVTRRSGWWYVDFTKPSSIDRN